MKKVTELKKANNIKNEDLLMIVQDGENKKIEYQELLLKKYVVQFLEDIVADAEYELPCQYIVGDDSLEIFVAGILQAKGYDYEEIGELGASSNKIQFKWNIKAGSILVIKSMKREVIQDNGR